MPKPDSVLNAANGCPPDKGLPEIIRERQPNYPPSQKSEKISSKVNKKGIVLTDDLSTMGTESPSASLSSSESSCEQLSGGKGNGEVSRKEKSNVSVAQKVEGERSNANEGRNDASPRRFSTNSDVLPATAQHKLSATPSCPPTGNSPSSGSRQAAQQRFPLRTGAMDEGKIEKLSPSKLPPKPLLNTMTIDTTQLSHINNSPDRAKLNSLKLGRSRSLSTGTRPPRKGGPAYISSSPVSADKRIGPSSAFVPIRSEAPVVSPSPPPSPRNRRAYPTGSGSPRHASVPDSIERSSPLGRLRRALGDSPRKSRHHPSLLEIPKDLHATGLPVRQQYLYSSEDVPMDDRAKGTFDIEMMPQHVSPSFRVPPQALFVHSPQLIPSPMAIERGKRKNGKNFVSRSVSPAHQPMVPKEQLDSSSAQFQKSPSLLHHTREPLKLPESPLLIPPPLINRDTSYSNDGLAGVNSGFFASSSSSALSEPVESNDSEPFRNETLDTPPENLFTPMTIAPSSEPNYDFNSASIKFLRNLNCHTPVVEADRLYCGSRYQDAVLCYSNIIDSLISRVQDRLSPEFRSSTVENAMVPPEEENLIHYQQSLRKKFLDHLYNRERKLRDEERAQSDTIGPNPALSRWTSSGNEERARLPPQEKTREIAGALAEPNEAHLALDVISKLIVKLGNSRFRLKEWNRAIQDYEDARRFQSHKIWLGKEFEARALSSTFRPIVEPDEDDYDEIAPKDELDGTDPTHSLSKTLEAASEQQSELVKLKEMQMEGQILNNVASAHFRTFQYQKATTGFGSALKCKRKALRATLKEEKERKSPAQGDANVGEPASRNKNGDDLHRVSILEISSTFHNIGLLRYKLSKYEKAIDAYKQSLLLRVERRGLEDLSVATTLGNLGDVYFAQGRYDSALRSYTDVLKILQSNVGKNHLRVASTLHNIGLVHRARGPYRDAKSVLLKALKIRKRRVGETSLDVSSTLYVLGLVQISMGELDDAMGSLAESLNIRMDLCRPKSHLLILNTQLAIGIVHHKLGNLDEAVSIFHAVLTERSRRLGKRHQAVSEVQQCIGLIHKDKGDYNAAIETLADALIIRESRFGRESVEAAETMNHLSISYFKVGEKNKAMSSCKESLRILKKKRGRDHISLAATLKHLGDLQQDLSQYEDAITSYEEVLRIRGNWVDHNHLDVGDTLNNIGNVRFKKGEFTMAKDVFKKALTIKKLWLDDDHISVITTLNNFGHALYKSCELDNALDSYTESLLLQLARLLDRKRDLDMDVGTQLEHVREKIGAISKREDANQKMAALSSSLGNIAATLRNIGLVHQDRGEFEKTMEVYNLILAVRKMQPVRDHAAIAMMAETIGMLHFKRRNYDGAMASFHEALEIKEGIQGKNTVDVARTLNNLANVHFSRGSLEEAMKLYQSALEIKRESLGHDHDEVSTTLNNIAHVLFTAGKEDESLQVYEEVLVIRKEKLGENHITISSTLSNMGDVHLKKGSLDYAKHFFERSVRIRKCHLGTNIPEHVRVVEKLASVYGRLCEWTKAESAYYDSLQLKRNLLGRDHEEIAKTLEYLAGTFMEQNHFDRAIPALNEALRIRKLYVGENHKGVLAALNRIALVHRKAGKPELALDVYTEIERIRKTGKQTDLEDLKLPLKGRDLIQKYSF